MSSELVELNVVEDECCVTPVKNGDVMLLPPPIVRMQSRCSFIDHPPLPTIHESLLEAMSPIVETACSQSFVKRASEADDAARHIKKLREMCSIVADVVADLNIHVVSMFSTVIKCQSQIDLLSNMHAKVTCGHEPAACVCLDPIEALKCNEQYTE